MTDDWSLKGKKVHLKYGYEYTIDFIGFEEYNTETLRQKLIKDFMGYYDRYLKYQIDENPDRYNFNYDVEKTVNKRFGVDK